MPYHNNRILHMHKGHLYNLYYGVFLFVFYIISFSVLINTVITSPYYVVLGNMGMSRHNEIRTMTLKIIMFYL